MRWSDMNDERDADGNLTPLAIALDSISGNGCDCGDDEPGTCLACVCEAALKHLWHQLNYANSIASTLFGEKKQREFLRGGEMIRQFLITLDLPDWARWYAVDEDGDVWVFLDKPYLNYDGGIWTNGTLNCKFVLTIADMTGIDWTQTLHEIERAA